MHAEKWWVSTARSRLQSIRDNFGGLDACIFVNGLEVKLHVGNIYSPIWQWSIYLFCIYCRVFIPASKHQILIQEFPYSEMEGCCSTLSSDVNSRINYILTICWARRYVGMVPRLECVGEDRHLLVDWQALGTLLVYTDDHFVLFGSSTFHCHWQKI